MYESKQLLDSIKMTELKEEITQENPQKVNTATNNNNINYLNNKRDINKNNSHSQINYNLLNAKPNCNNCCSKEKLKNLRVKNMYIFALYPKMKFCLIYLLIIMSLSTFIILNYYETKDAFDKNKYVLLPPEKICKKSLNIFSECIKEKNNCDKCVYENKAVEDCYDEANLMNQLCFIYLSELELCLRTSEKQNNDCKMQFTEVIECSSLYRYLQIDTDYLKEILLENN